jgi:hypothetical protein
MVTFDFVISVLNMKQANVTSRYLINKSKSVSVCLSVCMYVQEKNIYCNKFAGSISQWKFITLKAQYTTLDYSSQLLSNSNTHDNFSNYSEYFYCLLASALVP